MNPCTSRVGRLMTALPPRPSPPWSVPPCFGAGPPAATSQTPLHRLRRERVSILPDLHRTLRRQHKSHQASSSLRLPLLLGDPFTLTPYSVSYFTSTSRGNNGPVFLTELPRCLPSHLRPAPCDDEQSLPIRPDASNRPPVPPYPAVPLSRGKYFPSTIPRSLWRTWSW